jgi:hypothetical protein
MTPGPSARRVFHLGSAPARAGLDAVPLRGLTPALAGRYRDLSALRYDYPIVVLDEPWNGEVVQPLSAVMDNLLRAMADQDDMDRVASHVLDLERHVRAAVLGGERGSLSTLWARAETALGATNDLARDSLSRARAALAVDGELTDCDAGVAFRVIRRLWDATQRRKRAAFRAQAGRLAVRLAETLRSADAHGLGGRTSAALRASFGGPHRNAFDFTRLAGTLARTAPAVTISDERRRRLDTLVATLSAQRFHPAAGDDGLPFVFQSCAAALAAYRERLPRLRDLVRAMGAAELEAAGQYREGLHDPLLEGLAAGDLVLDGRDWALFPDYIVLLTASSLTAAEHAAVLEVLDSRLPIKIAIEIDDLLPASLGGEGSRSRARTLAQLASGLDTAFVVQAPASHLVRFGEAIARGLEWNGPALFSIGMGASPTMRGLPAYLVSALALESRLFPAFTFDPADGPSAARLDLSANPQREADWPCYTLDYEDDSGTRQSEPLAVTAADMLACDGRHARHFAHVPRAEWSADQVPLDRWLALGADDRRMTIPYLLLVDDTHRLQRVIVTASVVRETEACRDHWRSLQRQAAAAPGVAAMDAPVDASAAAAAAAPAPPEPVRESAEVAESGAAVESRPAGEPYIETPRCSSCNECIQLNGRMFKYNENKQAYVADASAGTFRELVEAAESCQVSIIHPGLPRRQDEPGLEELLQRAAAFA